MSKLMDDWGNVDQIKDWDDHQVLVITTMRATGTGLRS